MSLRDDIQKSSSGHGVVMVPFPKRDYQGRIQTNQLFPPMPLPGFSEKEQ